MFLGKRVAVPFICEQHVIIVAGLKRQIGGVVVERFEENELRR